MGPRPTRGSNNRHQPMRRSNQIVSGCEIITVWSHRGRTHSIPLLTSVQALRGCLEIYYGALALRANNIPSTPETAHHQKNENLKMLSDYQICQAFALITLHSVRLLNVGCMAVMGSTCQITFFLIKSFIFRLRISITIELISKNWIDLIQVTFVPAELGNYPGMEWANHRVNYVPRYT